MRRQEQVVLAAVRGVVEGSRSGRRRHAVDGRSDSADHTQDPSSTLDGLDSSQLTATQSIFVFGQRC